ncbi:MAG: M28 family peptidase [Cyanobacteria bacterium SID2]|nr:M28 family peptidase [Cyanobacteria bacterium SID2]MBP0004051.1 M28 family peptidase [Cyanobacteria bacterium SBC]
MFFISFVSLWLAFAISLLLFLGGCHDRNPSEAQLPPPNRTIESVAVPKLEKNDDTFAESVPIALKNPPQVNGERLFAHVQALAFPRNDEIDRSRARQYLIDTLVEAGWTPKLQAFEGGVNVIAEHPGTDSEAGSIVVAAHYDTVANAPGADDNASGVATVLELAQLFRDLPTPRTLTLVLFDREEDGLLGSFAYVNSADLKTLRGAIVLETIGYTCREPGCQTYPVGLSGTFPDTGDFLGVLGDTKHPELIEAFVRASREELDRSQASDLPEVVTLAVPVGGLMLPDLLRSDHAPFWFVGIGAVMVTDTAEFRNPNYHRSSDLPETLDRSFLSGSAQLVVNATHIVLNRTESRNEH